MKTKQNPARIYAHVHYPDTGIDRGRWLGSVALPEINLLLIR